MVEMQLFQYFLVYMCVHTTTGLDLNGRNVCMQYATVNIKSEKVKVIQLICCPDFFATNGTCQPCPAGYFGDECSVKCLRNHYGVQCKQTCYCSFDEACHPVQGCSCKDEMNCSARIGVVELKSKLLNTTSGLLQTSDVSSSQEEKATFQHIQVYTIIIAAMLLLVVIAAVSLKVKRRACKRNDQTDHMNTKTKKTNDLSKSENNSNLV